MVKCIVNAILTYCKIDLSIKNEFDIWFELVCRGIPKPAPQTLIIGGYKINGVDHKKQIKLNLDCFRKNNIFYADIPFNKGFGKNLKSRLNPPTTQVNQVDLLKQDAVLRIKEMSHQLSNADIIKKLSINRVFLSKILNSKIDGISTDYLLQLA